MKYKVFKNTLKPIIDALGNREATVLERNSYKMAYRSLWVSIASIVIAIIFGSIGIYYMQGSPDRGQLSRLLKQDSVLLSVQIDAINLNIEMSNMQKIEMLRKKFSRYNQVTLLFTELEQYTFLYELQKQHKAIVKTQSVDERLRIVKGIIDIFSQLEDLDDLLPMHNIASDYGKCATELMRYKMLYIDNMIMGAKVDTSLLGQNAFSQLMYHVIEMKDKTMPLMSEGRNRIERNIKENDSINIANKSIADSIAMKKVRK